ncbi:short chain dehydrogenase domain-containing protein [Phthorimaea operculella]|nr:short chain dehydrogenase domain-containing protein [Phthorimaea operculella]
MSESKVAIVTGANKGLGFALVKGLCEKFEGIVYLTSRDEKRGNDACKELNKLGYDPRFHQLDVTDPGSIARFCTYMKNKHGSVDLIINNAGVLFLKDAQEPRLYQAEQTLFVNFFALVNFCEVISPIIRDGGRIINISSSSGHLSRIPSEEIRKKLQNTDITVEELKSLMNSYVNAVKVNKDIEIGWGDSPYVVSKVGVNAYTFLLNRRLANRGITVNCVHPGYVRSDMTRGGGDRTAEQGAVEPLKLAVGDHSGGLYVWQDGQVVPWDGPDPRGYIDGKKV